MSYRFYDPILKIIQDECSDAKRDFFSLKNKLTLARIQDDDVTRKLLLSIGIDEELNSATKQVFKHSVVNQKESNEINHLASEHPCSLQRSEYIMIENDMERIRRQYEHFQGGKSEEQRQQWAELCGYSGKLNLRFAHEDEVLKKRMLFLVFKAAFLAKLKAQMQNGRSQFVLKKLSAWISDNIDMLYANFKRSLRRKSPRAGVARCSTGEWGGNTHVQKPRCKSAKNKKKVSWSETERAALRG